MTIDGSLTRCFGFCALARLGAIYLAIMAIGKIPIGVFVVGETLEHGRSYWNNWWWIPITNGS
jgi:hypothetical protein